MAYRSHSNALRDPDNTGAPHSPLSHGVAAKRSSPLPAKRTDAGCWPICSTLTAKCAADANIATLPALFAMQTKSRGGSRETDVNEFAVSSIGVPSAVVAVTIVTPVA